MKIFRIFFFFFFFFYSFFLLKSSSFASQNCRVGIPTICYINKNITTGPYRCPFENWYAGTWNVIGKIYCDSSSTGSCNGSLHIVSNGSWIVDKPFSISVGQYLDTNDTVSSTECNSIQYAAYCLDDTNPDSNDWFLPQPKDIPLCPNITITPTISVIPTNTLTPIPTNTIIPTTTTDPCPNGNLGNINCSPDGKINESDLNLIFVSWATNGPAPTPILGNRSADLNGDGKVDEMDLNILLINWNP